MRGFQRLGSRALKKMKIHSLSPVMVRAHPEMGCILHLAEVLALKGFEFTVFISCPGVACT
jgi:hypothetical protein